MMRKLTILLAVLLVLLVGCSQVQKPTAPAKGTTSSGYLAPPTAAASNPGYPVNSTAATPQAAKTSIPGTATVQVKISNNNAALSGTTFFLANTLKNSEGQEISTSLDPTTAPLAVSDPDGSVVFHNVKPGRYGLMLSSGMDTYLLLNPNDGKAILLTVKADDKIDLGDLKFTNLPVN
jgi:uncharacterized protein YceK